MTTENEKSSQVLITPADMTGAELHTHLSKLFYPFVAFKQKTEMVNHHINLLLLALTDAENAAKTSLDISSRYPGSTLQADLCQNYQRVMALQVFLKNFAPFPED